MYKSALTGSAGSPSTQSLSAAGSEVTFAISNLGSDPNAVKVKLVPASVPVSGRAIQNNVYSVDDLIDSHLDRNQVSIDNSPPWP